MRRYHLGSLTEKQRILGTKAKNSEPRQDTASTIRHDEKTADREVDLIARKLESGSKPRLKTKFGELRAHGQQYRTFIYTRYNAVVRICSRLF